MEKLLEPIHQFLQCHTPDAWIDEAKKPENLQTILIDHLHCELKAAQSAGFLIRRYTLDEQGSDKLLQWLKPYEDFVYRKIGDGQFGDSKNGLIGELTSKDDTPTQLDILDKMTRLIKEELHHFEQVLGFIRQRNVEIVNLTAARYASSLIRQCRNYEPEALIDKLIIGAYIEARSCERFAKIAPYLDDELSRFYISLLRSEARHYQDYLSLAEQIAKQDISERVTYFGQVEAKLITSPDPIFRFHSGVPSAS